MLRLTSFNYNFHSIFSVNAHSRVFSRKSKTEYITYLISKKSLLTENMPFSDVILILCVCETGCSRATLVPHSNTVRAGLYQLTLPLGRYSYEYSVFRMVVLKLQKQVVSCVTYTFKTKLLITLNNPLINKNKTKSVIPPHSLECAQTLLGFFNK